MLNVIISGSSGAMGRVVASAIAKRTDCTVVAGFDINPGLSESFPVFANPEDFTGKADVVIDFSHPSMLQNLLAFSVSRKIPAVIATTGISPAGVAEITAASQSVPIFYAANMSLGINLLIELVKKAAATLCGDFDIEIIEKHHHNKVDAPSGTALRIAHAIEESVNFDPRFVYDRHAVRQKRSPEEIGIHAVRGGTIVGEHEVLFCGQDEVLSISHAAYSKEIFAVGAVNAAIFLAGKQPGLYDMPDLISEI